MPETQTNEKNGSGGNIFKTVLTIFGAIAPLYGLYQLWSGDRGLANYFFIMAGLAGLTYLAWVFGFGRSDSHMNLRVFAQIVFVLLVLFAIPTIIANFVQAVFGENIVYRYAFEAGDPANNCWQIRQDERNVFLGDQISFSDENRFSGKQSLRLDVTLQDPALAGKTVNAQIDASKKAGPACPGTWNIPDEGRIQTWVCLPSDAGDQVVLSAEFFLQYRDDNGFHWNSSGPVVLTPGQWTLVRWDSDHDPFATWRAWSQEYQQQRAISIGLEVKFSEDSALKSYQGPLYIDEFVVTDNQEAYQIFQQEDQYFQSAGCP